MWNVFKMGYYYSLLKMKIQLTTYDTCMKYVRDKCYIDSTEMKRELQKLRWQTSHVLTTTTTTK